MKRNGHLECSKQEEPNADYTVTVTPSNMFSPFHQQVTEPMAAGPHYDDVPG